MNAYVAYSLVALIASVASLLIALIAMNTSISITNGWAAAVMVSAPMAMAVGVSFFINRTHCAFAPPREPDRRLPPDDPYGEGSFAPVRRG